MTGIDGWSFLFVLGFVAVHFGSKYMGLSTSNPRSPWLSAFGGVAIAYVFLYLLPELSKYLAVMEEHVGDSWLRFLADYTYLLALIGLLAYYGLDILAKTKNTAAQDNSETGSLPVFLVHLSSFFLYNVIIGYLLIKEEFPNQWGLTLYFLALAVHFIATDHTLKDLHKEKYNKYGRWFLVGAIAVGWGIGAVFKVHEVIVGIAVSILSGGILLNVFKDELKESTFKNYTAFLGGALVIALLVMLVKG